MNNQSGQEDRGYGRRLVRSGELFTSGELERGEIDLELPEPSGPEPKGGGYEPWARDGSKREKRHDRERLRAYLEFVAERGVDNGDDS